MVKVSIVMPVYNGARFLDAAMASALADDFESFELVAVDDGSTDETPALLAAWAARDPRVRVVRRETNGGIPAALNDGLHAARGEYVARFDADDLFVPGRLRRQAEVLDRYAEVVLVSTWFEVIDDERRTLGVYKRAENPVVTAFLLSFFNVIGGHAQVMFRRKLVLSLGGYREEYATAEDYDLWNRLAEQGAIVVLPFVGLRRRHHARRAGSDQREIQREASRRTRRRVLTQFLGRRISDDELRAIEMLWRGDEHFGLSHLAEPLCREAFARFDADPDDRLRVRILTADRWTIVAGRCLRRGRVRECLRALGFALRWQPIGVLTGIAALLKQLRPAHLRLG